MIITTSRPYFAPYAGYFFKAHLADVFVILDSVQFPRGTTWITRNRLKNDQGAWWLTVPVRKKGLGLQKINDVCTMQEARWVHKHVSGIRHAYKHAPYIDEHLQFIESVYASETVRLIDFNLKIIRHLMLYMGIDTEIRRLSELNIQASGDQLLIEIVRFFDADVYLAPAAAAKYIDAGLFEKAGIEFRTVGFRAPVYPQLWGDFIPDLSAFDLLFNCGPKARDIVMSQVSA
jgi:hypothetical protein